MASPFAETVLPALNACLNGTSAVFLFAGWRAIKARQVGRHWRLMVAAVTPAGSKKLPVVPVGL